MAWKAGSLTWPLSLVASFSKVSYWLQGCAGQLDSAVHAMAVLGAPYSSGLVASMQA